MLVMNESSNQEAPRRSVLSNISKDCSWDKTREARRFQNTLLDVIEKHKKRTSLSSMEKLSSFAGEVEGRVNLVVSQADLKVPDKQQHQKPSSGNGKSKANSKLERGRKMKRQSAKRPPQRAQKMYEVDARSDDEDVETSRAQLKAPLRKFNTMREALCQSKPAAQKQRVILPNETWKLRWNALLILAIWSSAVITPIRVAFYDDTGPIWLGFQLLMDLIFFVDIILTFFSAYYNSKQELIVSRRQIARSYVRGWFWIDVIAILPLHFITHSAINQLGKLARFPRAYKLSKAMKLIGSSRLMKTKPAEQSDRFIAFALVFAVLCHTLACSWCLLAKLQGYSENSWILRYNYDDSPIEEQYMAALYFIVATITTVGYGDISAKTIPEKAFCVGLMILGVLAYSSAIGAFSSIISASDKRKKRLNLKLRTLKLIRHEFGLNFQLYWRLRRALHSDNIEDQDDRSSLVRSLPQNLRIQLNNIIYARKLEGIAFFQGKRAKFISSVAPLLKTIHLREGEYVYLKGDSLDGVHFLLSGSVAYIEPNSETPFAYTSQGKYFGGQDFAASSQEAEARRYFTVQAQTDLEILLLPKDDLFALDLEFRSEVHQLFKKAPLKLERLSELKVEAENKVKSGKDYTPSNFDSNESDSLSDSSYNLEYRSEDAQPNANKPVLLVGKEERKSEPLSPRVLLHKPCTVFKELSRQLSIRSEVIKMSSLTPGDSNNRSDAMSTFGRPQSGSSLVDDEELDGFECEGQARVKSRSIKESTRVQNLVELYRGG